MIVVQCYRRQLASIAIFLKEIKNVINVRVGSVVLELR